ncbi:MAG: hypothetical protein FWF96_06090, partial [Kiritimatiellaeota bacterium]|nr:hypothetical protein [Kiritimatiellota bacterium]
RLKGLGARDPKVARTGNGTFEVVLPKPRDEAFVVDCLARRGALEFRLVHEDNDDLVEERLAAPPEGFVENEDGNGWWMRTPDYAGLASDPEYHRQLSRMGCGELPGHSMMLQRGKGESFSPVIVSNHCELDGRRLKSAAAVQNILDGEYQISLVFDREGAQQFRQVTRANIRRRLAIIVDGVLYSAPTIHEEITGGRAQISGFFSEDEARLLANLLNAGGLPAPLKRIDKPNTGAH